MLYQPQLVTTLILINLWLSAAPRWPHSSLSLPSSASRIRSSHVCFPIMLSTRYTSDYAKMGHRISSEGYSKVYIFAMITRTNQLTRHHRYKVSLLPLIPSIVHQLVNYPGIEKVDFSSVTSLGSGAAYLPSELKAKFSSLVPREASFTEGSVLYLYFQAKSRILTVQFWQGTACRKWCVHTFRNSYVKLIFESYYF